MQRLERAAAGALLILSLAAPAAGDSLTLANGDVLTGTLVGRTDVGWTLDHPVLGRLEVPHERVAAMAAGDGAPAVTAAAPDAKPAVAPGLFGTRFLRGWERHIEIGVDGSEGNTNEFDGIVRLLGEAEDERRRWKVDSGYFYSSDDGDTAQHKGHFDLERDWLRADSRWFFFGDARWDYDQFEDWSHRLALGGGTGYDLFEQPSFDLRSRLGFNLQRTFGGEDDEITPELLLGLEGEWRISERVKVTASNRLYPSLRALGELRNVTDSALFLAVSEADGLGFKLGIHNEYESDVEADTKENDLRYYGALVVDF